jgi:hypothetical protein
MTERELLSDFASEAVTTVTRGLGGEDGARRPSWRGWIALSSCNEWMGEGRRGTGKVCTKLRSAERSSPKKNYSYRGKTALWRFLGRIPHDGAWHLRQKQAISCAIEFRKLKSLLFMDVF